VERRLVRGGLLPEGEGQRCRGTRGRGGGRCLGRRGCMRHPRRPLGCCLRQRGGGTCLLRSRTRTDGALPRFTHQNHACPKNVSFHCATPHCARPRTRRSLAARPRPRRQPTPPRASRVLRARIGTFLLADGRRVDFLAYQRAVGPAWPAVASPAVQGHQVPDRPPVIICAQGGAARGRQRQRGRGGVRMRGVRERKPCAFTSTSMPVCSACAQHAAAGYARRGGGGGGEAHAARSGWGGGASDRDVGHSHEGVDVARHRGVHHGSL
jgi:hypothetical protein